MPCPKCAERVAGVLAREPGIREVSVSFSARQGRIGYNPHAVEKRRVVEVIERAGFYTANG